ncbi:MAG: nucleotidyl transferase AbiEii/AbiGii toxin family protein [Candidatus Aenigmatarchaeota archaeon]
MISKEMLLEIGKKKGLKNKEHIEKDYFQDVFLLNLFGKTNRLVFKGGTAIYKLYGLSRFSEDLDFSSLDSEPGSVERIIEHVLDNIDFFELKGMKRTKDSLLIRISADGILTKYNSLRIDVNLRNKIISGFDVKNYVSEYVDINPFSMRVLKPGEMMSEKVHSLFARKNARDLFDLFFLLRMSKLDKNLVKEKLKIFGMKYDEKLLKKKINDIEDIWDKELKAFVLAELPDFDVVKKFVLVRLGIK